MTGSVAQIQDSRRKRPIAKVQVPADLQRFVPLPNFIIDHKKEIDPWEFGKTVGDGMAKYLFERYGINNTIHSLDIGIYSNAATVWLMAREEIRKNGIQYERISKDGAMAIVSNPAVRTARLSEQTMVTIAARYGLSPAYALSNKDVETVADVRGMTSKWLDMRDDD